MVKTIMLNFISPNFSYEKLESPNFNDLVDVFEDRMRNWFLLPAYSLLHIPHCQIASVSLLMNYFEGIEIYLVGKDSKDNSQNFFRNGFFKVFDFSAVSEDLREKMVDELYKQARCGFAHEAMFRNRVFFSETHPKPILITWPKKGEEFDVSGKVESIVINPMRFYNSVQRHFDQYIKTLRDEKDQVLKEAFEETVTLKWGLGEPDRAIGMTEREFFKI